MEDSLAYELSVIITKIIVKNLVFLALFTYNWQNLEAFTVRHHGSTKGPFPFTRFLHLQPFRFLDASTHLYKRVCPSVGPWSVRGPSRVFFKSRKSRGNDIESLENKI